MKLQKKLFLSYLFFISLFSVLFAGCFLLFFTDYTERELHSSAATTYLQASTLLNYQLRQNMYASYLVNTSAEIEEASAILQKESELPPGRQLVYASQIRTLINRSVLSLTNTAMRIYIEDGFSYILDHNTFESLSQLEQYPWYADFLSGKKQTFWAITGQSDSSNGPSLSFFRKIETSSDTIWISETYIHIAELRKILTMADPTEKGIVFLELNDGTILSNSDLRNSEPLAGITASLSGQKHDDWERISVNGAEYFLYRRTLDSTGWYMTLLLPAQITLSFQTGLMKYTPIVFIFILAISLLAAHTFTDGISFRILQLEKKMEAVCAGDLNVRMEEKGADEIAHLFRSFNQMVNKIELLAHQQYINGMQLKEAELKALQAQINPHFLYNTLELINWKAMESDSWEIMQISQDLASFYRLTLSNGNSMVPLRDELEHVSRYLNIQNLRFSREIQLVIDVPDSCLTLLMPKLTLQPLVENSILHGFIPQKDLAERDNIIRLTASSSDTALTLTLWDNGIGMTEEQLSRVFTKNSIDSRHGFGIINIQQRIQTLYGVQYGLSYESLPGQGTCVTIRLKA